MISLRSHFWCPLAGVPTHDPWVETYLENDGTLECWNEKSGTATQGGYTLVTSPGQQHSGISLHTHAVCIHTPLYLRK